MRSEPLNWLFSLTEEAIVGWIVNRGCQKLLIIGPLYRVMVITPAKEIKVPRTFDIPWGFLRSRTSNLSATAIMKVREAMQLTMEAIKVGDVYLKLAKYIFSVKLTLQFFLILYKLGFHTCIYITIQYHAFFVICPYPNTESTKNSINRENVSFVLTFLQKKQQSTSNTN